MPPLLWGVDFLDQRSGVHPLLVTQQQLGQPSEAPSLLMASLCGSCGDVPGFFVHTLWASSLARNQQDLAETHRLAPVFKPPASPSLQLCPLAGEGHTVHRLSPAAEAAARRARGGRAVQTARPPGQDVGGMQVSLRATAAAFFILISFFFFKFSPFASSPTAQVLF